MNNLLYQNEVRLCKQDVCLEVRGRNADLIVAAIVVAIILLAIAAAARA